MFKTLLKKQFSEVFSFLFVDKRKGKRRSNGGIILSAVLYIVLFLFMMVGFYALASQLCAPLVSTGLAWFYFALFGLFAMLFGVLGSAFATYASMYVAKDNEMLFSMPIKPRTILASRLVSVYLLSLLYVMLMYLPAAVKYAIEASPIGFIGILLLVLTPFALALLAFAISCLLGWLISIVAKRIKNKSFVTVIALLLFLGIYYFFCFRISSIIKMILEDPLKFSETLRTYAYPFYLMGKGADGDAVSFLLFALICIASAALVYLLISLGFAKTVIGGGSVSQATKKAKYLSKDIRSASVSGTLFKKELARFTSSPNYMLNSSINVVFMIASAVMLFLKGGYLRDMLAAETSINTDLMALFVCAAACMLSSMNTITASAVSLEGKNLWIVQSLPVEPKTALWAKLKLQLAIVLPALALLLAAMLTSFRFPLLHTVTICTVSVLFVVFLALFGLAANLKWANVKWTNEVVPLKQSLSVFLASFGGFVLLALLGFLYHLLSSKLGVAPLGYLAITTALLALLCLVLYRLIATWGSRRFAELD